MAIYKKDSVCGIVPDRLRGSLRYEFQFIYLNQNWKAKAYTKKIN